MKALEGKVALVTGGGKGVGRSVALALASRGVRIVVTGRDERALGETVGEIAFGGGKARHLAGDVRDPVHLGAAADRAVEVFGGLDIVIANAARAWRAGAGEDRQTAEAILATNLTGTYNTFDAALVRMRGPGRLLATNLRGWARPGAAPAGYAACRASDAGIVGLVRAISDEVAPRRITCNAIVRGWGEIEAAEPGEIAELVIFLCSPAADGITGQTISMRGATASRG